MIKVGILGAGNIAGVMADTLRRMDNVICCAVAARDGSRAEAFAKTYGFAESYGSYEEMLASSEAELIYVATPHSCHYDHVKLCLQYGKHVLCEKAFMLNAKQAEEVFAMAKEKGLLLTEAIWTRYMPSRRMLQDVLDGGAIGKPQMLTANLGYVTKHKERIQKLELGGGALLDVGIYPLTFASLILGDDVTKIRSQADLSDTGVDRTNQILLTYASGAQASIFDTIAGPTDREGVIYGEKGYATVGNVNNYQYLRIYDAAHKLQEEILCPPQVTGYEYELQACVEAMDKGWTECPDAPHAMSITMMELMDIIRGQWGLEYPEL